ncbi:lysophospholipase [Melampsora americana]|nr:lysophospholipase [Melampsora americana]
MPSFHLLKVYTLLCGVIVPYIGFVNGEKAIENSPSGGYAPIKEDCPTDFKLNLNHTAIISDGEASYVQEKASKSVQGWVEYLTRVNLTDFDVADFLSSATSSEGSAVAGQTLPNIGFAASGGGHRAMLYSASILAAFDGRESDARDSRTGGILQLMNYISGLSGGAWMLGSWAVSDFPDFQSMQNSSWKLTGDEKYVKMEIGQEYPAIANDIKRKKHAGFPVSIVDPFLLTILHRTSLWGRFVAGKLIDAPNEAQSVLFTSIKETKAYQAREVPFPILIAVSRSGQTLTLDSAIYEFTPEDFSVSHPGLNSSIPMKYLGTRPPTLPDDDPECVEGFDNIGFVLGLTSNIFTTRDASSASNSVWSKITHALGSQSIYEGLVPNPFQGFGDPNTFPDHYTNTLMLADGGFAGEKLPLFPLLHRNLDVIFASDASVDGGTHPLSEEGGYPNGTSLYMTYLKTQQPQYHRYRFPEIPNALNGTFAERGYNKRPTFFGCDATPETPIVVYLPNYFVVAPTDMTTRKITFTDEQIKGFFRNGHAIATQALSRAQNGDNGTRVNHSLASVDWPSCLACALIDRQNTRNGKERTPQCKRCFQDYCG